MWMIITRFIGLKMCRKSFGRWVSSISAFMWVLSRPAETDIKPTPFHLCGCPLLLSFPALPPAYYNIERLCLKCHSEYDRQWMLTLRNMLILYCDTEESNPINHWQIILALISFSELFFFLEIFKL